MFKGSRLKVDWAKRHISELEITLQAFFDAKPYRFVVEVDTDPEYFGLVIRGQQELPDSVSLLIGDAIHNLRVALDRLAVELVTMKAPASKGVKFPFCADAGSLEKTIKKRRIDRAGPDVVNRIRGLKPYKGGNNPLRGLHDLDIADKHERPIITVAVAGWENINRFVRESGNIILGSAIVDIKDGVKFLKFPADGRAKLDEQFDISTKIIFDDGFAFERRDVIPTLHQLASMVEDIINDFEAIIRKRI